MRERVFCSLGVREDTRRITTTTTKHSAWRRKEEKDIPKTREHLRRLNTHLIEVHDEIPRLFRQHSRFARRVGREK